MTTDNYNDLKKKHMELKNKYKDLLKFAEYNYNKSNRISKELNNNKSNNVSWFKILLYVILAILIIVLTINITTGIKSIVWVIINKIIEINKEMERMNLDYHKKQIERMYWKNLYY
jgi:hypothetical protein